MNNKGVKIVVLTVVGVFGFVTYPRGSPSPNPSVPVQTPQGLPSDKIGALLACPHFRDVMADETSGLLTDAEFRGKLQEVYSDSLGASPAIQSAAEAMLVAATAGDSNGLARASGKMYTACMEAQS